MKWWRRKDQGGPAATAAMSEEAHLLAAVRAAVHYAEALEPTYVKRYTVKGYVVTDKLTGDTMCICSTLNGAQIAAAALNTRDVLTAVV